MSMSQVAHQTGVEFLLLFVACFQGYNNGPNLRPFIAVSKMREASVIPMTSNLD